MQWRIRMNRIAIGKSQILIFWDTIRSFCIWFLMILSTLVIGVAANSLALLRASNAVHHVARAWGRTMAFISGVRITVHGKEKLYKSDTAIVLSNHQGMQDILVMYSFLSKQFRWMAKASLFRIPVVGSAMAGAGYIPVERGDKKKSLQSLMQAAAQIRAGKSIIMFPEGTIGTKDGRMIPFKKGSFILAKKSNVTIQPISIWGTHDAIPDQPQNFMPRIYPGAVHVHVHDPIAPEEYEAMSAEELSLHVRNIIEAPILEHFARQNELERVNIRIGEDVGVQLYR